MSWAVIGVLCAGTVLFKASGPLALRRRPSERALRVIALVAPAVLTGLVLAQTFGGAPSGLHVDARVAGLAAAAAALAARWPVVAVVATGAAATALVRLLA